MPLKRWLEHYRVGSGKIAAWHLRENNVFCSVGGVSYKP